MSSEEQWMDGFEDTWKEFREELHSSLEAMGPGGLICLEMMAPDSVVSVDEGVAPYVQLMFVEGHGVLGEVSSNAYLAPAYTLDAEAEALLEEIGWQLPADTSECPDPTEANFWYAAEPPQLDWLALMAVRVVREVFGVVHPAFLEVAGLGSPEAEADLEDEEAVVFSTCRDELVALVDRALTPFFESIPIKDDDGDVPVRTGDSVIYVHVPPHEPAVEIFSVVVTDVTDAPRALTEINILNRGHGGFTWSFRDGRITARRRLLADPFVPDQLRRLLDCACRSIDEIAGDLVARVGGSTFCSEASVEPSTPPERPVSSRTWMQTVLNLEEDEPGSVDPRLAAHIFQHDQVAILEQIARQRRSGRPEMVALLRGALRVVVESEFESLPRSSQS